MATLFISDTHLCAERPAMMALFEDFLRRRVAEGDTLYILGDLFEAWLGDDAIQPDQRSTIEALRRAADRGVTIAVMHGNRDFLLGADFAALAGVQPIPDPTIVTVEQRRVLLMHGDTLCTDDADYQAYRARVRAPAFRREVALMTPEQRRTVARQYRDESHQATRGKSAVIMDVNPGAVVQAMRAHHVDLLIHGHTHRPAVHDLALDGGSGRRIVLGAWYEQGSVCVADGGEFRLASFAAQQPAAVPQ